MMSLGIRPEINPIHIAPTETMGLKKGVGESKQLIKSLENPTIAPATGPTKIPARIMGIFSNVILSPCPKSKNVLQKIPITTLIAISIAHIVSFLICSFKKIPLSLSS